jgi:phosphoenolpyruvate carboxylase
MELTARTTARADEDPFGNPVLLVALAIWRRIQAGMLDDDTLSALVRCLRDDAVADRARRIADYVGGIDVAAHEATLKELAQRLLRPDPNDRPVRWAEYRALVERARFAAVFTAHPTFALPADVAQRSTETASGRHRAASGSHRPPPITLAAEFEQATAAIARGHDAIDQFNAALLRVARGAWPDRWTQLNPRPVILSSWVGYDTDGRTDIGWWDTLRLRLEMKRRQLVRLHAQVVAEPIAARVAAAVDAVANQLALCPDAPDPPRVAAFAHALVEQRDVALTSPQPLLPLF